MSELGEKYKLAEEAILQRWATMKDENGCSQTWKILAIQEDRCSNKNSGLMQLFVEEVESIVDAFEKDRLVITELPIPSTSSREPVAVEPITPHGI